MKNHDFYMNLTDSKGRIALFKEITNVRDFLSLKLSTLELLYTQWNGNYDKKSCSFPYLHIDDNRLHRAFIVSNNKIVSFGFSLRIIPAKDHIKEFFLKGHRFNSKQISEAQMILNHIDEKTLYRELEDDDLEDELSVDGEYLFEYLLFEEPAYIRYDYDKKTNSEIIHPVNHFDINFTPNFSFKLGLPRQINEEDYNNILDKGEVCQRLNISKNYRRLNRGWSKNQQITLKEKRKSRK